MPRLKTWLTVWAGWTALALFLAVSSSLTYQTMGDPPNWRLSATRTLSDWWVWALLTPVVVWLARRFPVDGARRWPHLGAHIVAGLAIAVVKTVASRMVFGWVTGIWTYLLVSTIALEVVIYGCIVAAAHGAEYYRRSREREQLEARLSDTRLQLLTMQLQPHFLFNTLNTIAELVHEDADAADSMIVGFSDLLRRTLELETARSIPLREELVLLDKYLAIQQVRYGGRLSIDVQVDEAVAGAAVPVLLLQPIVENAVRHTISRHAGAVRIRVTARREEGRLKIDVVDDGKAADSEGPHGGTGRGLSNTRARIEALYGNTGRLDLQRLPEGTRVELDLPLMTPGAPA